VYSFLTAVVEGLWFVNVTPRPLNPGESTENFLPAGFEPQYVKSKAICFLGSNIS
jgi:hypothetical protein